MPPRGLPVLRDEVGARFIQFIPIVERDPATETVTPASVRPDQYGRFLSGVFDEWVRHDVAQIYVQHFDAALANWYGEPPGCCVFSPTCGQAMVIEHNGDVYSCDHFVDPDHLLGNIIVDPLGAIVGGDEQQRFGEQKRTALPAYCRACRFLFACRGECPKNRFCRTPDGEAGLNYLCEGYRTFFDHIVEPMQFMVRELQAGRAPANIMRRGNGGAG